MHLPEPTTAVATLLVCALGAATSLQAAEPARQKTQEQQAAVAAPPRAPPPRRAPASAGGAPLPATPPPAESPPKPSTTQQLLTARQWLATGRPDEARRLLAVVQTQMVLQPVTPDQPAAQGGNASATEVGNAIRWLDIGANGQAMQALDRAINGAGAKDGSRPWPSYPAAAPPGYRPNTQNYYSNGTTR